MTRRMEDVLWHLVLLLLATLLGLTLVSRGLGILAEPSRIACEVQGWEGARRSFSTVVTCVPRPTTTDTVILMEQPS